MPRRHRSARDRGSEAPTTVRPPAPAAPAWARVEGSQVRRVPGGAKAYRCPGCDHEIRPGFPHLVVVPVDDPGQRRHWHTECWRKELRRTRRG